MAPPKERHSKQKITKRAQRQSPVDYEVLYEQETHRDWDLLSFEEQQKYVESKIAEEEKRQTIRQKISHTSMSDPSQQASGSGTVPAPPSTPMTLETMGHAIQSLMQAMNVMVTTVNTLTTTVNVASSVRPRATKVAVSKPKAWNGKGGSMEARHFLAAF